MPTIVECSCGKKVKIPDHLIGKKVKCPCGNTIDTASDCEQQEQLPVNAPKNEKIQIKCTCGKALNIPEHLIGKKVKCPCGNVLTAASEEDTTADDPENIAQGFVSVYAVIGYIGNL